MKREPDEKKRDRERCEERERERDGKKEKAEKVKMDTCNHCNLMRTKCFLELIGIVTFFVFSYINCF